MDRGHILLGGLLTAGGGAVVQLWVVPRAQARTRGRERWENDMRSLAALLEEELPRTLSAYDSTGYAVRHFRGILQRAQGNEAEKAQQLVRAAEAESVKPTRRSVSRWRG